MSDSHTVQLSDAFDRAIETLKADSARYQWLKARQFGADFEYGEPAVSVITFLWPSAPISADLDKSIDDAMAARQATASGNPENEATK